MALPGVCSLSLCRFMLHTAGDHEEPCCAVTAAAELTACHICTQRGHCQSESKVEYDAFPPGDKVLLPGHAYNKVYIQDCSLDFNVKVMSPNPSNALCAPSENELATKQ